MIWPRKPRLERTVADDVALYSTDQLRAAYHDAAGAHDTLVRLRNCNLTRDELAHEIRHRVAVGRLITWLTSVAAIATIAAVLLALGACSSTGVLPAGPDTYMITEQRPGIAGGGPAAQSAAISEAAQYCASAGKQYLPMNMQMTGAPGFPQSYSVTFRCLAKDDPELRRPNFQKTPDIVIEQRQ